MMKNLKDISKQNKTVVINDEYIDALILKIENLQSACKARLKKDDEMKKAQQSSQSK